MSEKNDTDLKARYLQDLKEETQDIERAALGCLILEEETATRYASAFRVEYFTEWKHQELLRLIQERVAKGDSTNMLLLVPEMVKRRIGDNQECGILLTDLMDQVTSSAYLPQYLEHLRVFSVRRQLTTLAWALWQDAVNLTNNPDGLVETYMGKLMLMQRQRPWEKAFQMQMEVAQQAFEWRQERLERKKALGISGIHTGIPKLDDFTDGWQPDELVVIGGQNGDGKSWFMIHHLLAAATHGHKCLVYSLEMSSQDLYARELMMNTQATSHDWYQGTSKPEVQAQIEEVRPVLDALPITYVDRNEYDINRLCAMARELHQKEQCEVLFIDYAQIIRASEQVGFEKRVDVVTDITHKLKQLAKQLHIPVVVLAQLNRNQVKSPDGRPHKSDLRESGSLEHDADRIWLIYRPALFQVREYRYNHKDYDTENLIVYLCEKDRRFGKKEILLRHNEAFTAFSQLD